VHELDPLDAGRAAVDASDARDLLEIDQGSPDDLLLLQLACRARELGLAWTS
jgi:hypothetical protein